MPESFLYYSVKIFGAFVRALPLGVAMGARGATASSEAADVVLIVDRLDRLAAGVVIAKRARAIARQSVLLGMALSLLGMSAAGAGLLAPVGGAIAQEVIDVLGIGTALRALRPPGSLRRIGSVPDSWSHQLAEGHGVDVVVHPDGRPVSGGEPLANRARHCRSRSV